MNRANRREAIIKRTLVLMLLLVITSPIALANDGQKSCSLEVSLTAERVKDENPEEDWSFVILTGSGDEKTYHRVKVASQKRQDGNPNKEVHIGSTDSLAEGEFYMFYSEEYSGKEEVFVGLQAISDGHEQASGFGSTEFKLNCEEMFSEEDKNAVMSTLDENAFTVTVTKNKGSNSNTETVWNVSTFVFYHGQHEPRFQLADLAKPLGLLLWLGWSWNVIF